ncbi:TRAP transporter large permease [Chloroflexota bacterium]
MNETIIAFAGLGAVIFLLFCRMPVAFAMALVGFLGFAWVGGLKGALAVLGMIPFHTIANYNFTVVPLFILMGEFAFHSGISKGLYEFNYKWLGHLPGGLAMATIGGCALFAAISGSSFSTGATMGTIALPEMKRYKYDPALATGCVAAGGTLGILIPPSIGFIVYGILTEESIGRLFIAGILPGVLLASLFMLTIYLRVRLNPKLAPPGPVSSLKDRLISLKGIWETATLFTVCIGGLYLGIVTPVEAGGVGAMGALTIGLAKRKLGWQNIFRAIVAAVELTTMIFAIMFCAYIFGAFIAISNLPFKLAEIIVALQLPSYLILVGILVIYIIAGCLMEFIAMMILTLPIFLPIVNALGYDPIWFGVIMVIMLEMAQITPPIGILVYTIKGVAGDDVPLSTVFRGILPFWVAQGVCVAILIIFPQIALFLPTFLMK